MKICSLFAWLGLYSFLISIQPIEAKILFTNEYISRLRNIFNDVLSGEIPVLKSITEVVVRRCSAKKVFLKISQNLQEIICARLLYSLVKI